jgi:hypothetical protein
MTPEQLTAFLPTLGTWLIAGLMTGWLAGLLAHASDRRR